MGAFGVKETIYIYSNRGNRGGASLNILRNIQTLCLGSFGRGLRFGGYVPVVGEIDYKRCSSTRVIGDMDAATVLVNEAFGNG